MTREIMSELKKCAQFLKLLYICQTLKLPPKTKMVNPQHKISKEIQGQIIVCKTLLHSVKHELLTVK